MREKVVKTKGDAKSNTAEHSVWLERPPGIRTSKSLTPLGRIPFRCTASDFQPGDRVIGTVLKRTGDSFSVDIGYASPATLHYLSFEGASKKNRPEISAGDVIYATIKQADRDLEIGLSCTDEAGRACGMGILGRCEPGTVGNAGGMAGGVMLYCSPNTVRRLTDQSRFPLLPLLAKHFRFEVTLGANGWIWLTCHTPQELVTLANVLSMAEHLSEAGVCEFVKSLTLSLEVE